MARDNVNSNKQTRIYSENGKFIRVSNDEAIARGLNQWRGWKCAAGSRSLYIDYDGNIWGCNTAQIQLDRFNKREWHKTMYAVMPLPMYFVNRKNPPDAVWKDKPIQYYLDNDIKMFSDWEKESDVVLKDFLKRDDAFNKFLANTDDNKKKYPGFLGNIVEGFTSPVEWTTCSWDSCGCGFDVPLAKAKTDANKNSLIILKEQKEGLLKTENDEVDELESAPTAVEHNFNVPYQILWDLSRKCNYDCSYCWPTVHNRTAVHTSYDVLIKTVDNIIDNWANNETIRWNFGGGEPTLHPQFIKLMQHLREKNQWSMVTSNGTRDYKYWGELANYINSVLLSAHFDGLQDEADEDRFIRNVEVICKNFEKRWDDHWIEVKIMAPPQHFDRALKFREKLKKLELLHKVGENARITGSFSLVPIRSMGNSGQLVKYTDEQIKYFQNQ